MVVTIAIMRRCSGAVSGDVPVSERVVADMVLDPRKQQLEMQS